MSNISYRDHKGKTFYRPALGLENFRPKSGKAYRSTKGLPFVGVLREEQMIPETVQQFVIFVPRIGKVA